MENLTNDEMFSIYILRDLEKNAQAQEYLNLKREEFQEHLNHKRQESENKKNQEVFVLKMMTKKKVVVCESCYKSGQVLSQCPKCGGKGIHFKSYQCWEVSPHKVKIDKIDRDPKSGKLRYWTSMSEFYHEEVYPEDNKYVKTYPHGIHLVHFSLEEAIIEANRLNEFMNREG